MSKYRINPSEVEKVLKATAADAKEFEAIFKPLPGHVQDAQVAGADLGPLGIALDAFFTAQTESLKVIGDRVSNGIAGAVMATKAYIKGDDHMVQVAQTKASTLTLAAELERKAHPAPAGHPHGGIPR